jgi:hypothetical protein
METRSGPGIYRPRHPERTAFYRLVSEHLDRYVGTYEERFEPREGPLRGVVPRAAEAFLECGRLANGFARIRCPRCRGEHLLAFSCQTRNFCPSCQGKRAALLGEWVVEEVAAPVSHRHVVFTIPRALRGLFERERRLLGILSRCAYESVRRTWGTGFGVRGARPGMVASIQTFGSYVNFHPHVHAVVTDGVMTVGGEFLRVPEWTPGVIGEMYRRLVLGELVRAERLTEEFREELLSWSPTGFSVYGEQVVGEDEPERLERVVRYMVRPPVALGAVEETGKGRVRVETPVDPRTGKAGVELDPLEWLHAVGKQVPDPGQHLVRYYGIYANRVRREWASRWEARGRGRGRTAEGVIGNAPGTAGGEEGGRPGSRQGSWARLLRRILEVDPLVCPRCGVAMRVVSVITEPGVVDRILAWVMGNPGDPFEGRGPPKTEGVSVS